MPECNGMGPGGWGPMTGRAMGPCGGSRVREPGRGRDRGYGMGRGRARGFAGSRCMGWAAVGYGPGGLASASANMRTALEERKAYLRAELARTEALLSDGPRTGSQEGGEQEK